MFGASNNKGLTGNKIKKAIISDSLCDPALNSYASTHGRSNIIYALRVADIGHMITGGGGDSTNLGGGSEEIINTSLTTTGNEIVDDLLNNNELFRDSLLSIIPEFKELFYYTGNGSLSLEQYETAIVPLLSLENLMFGLMQQDANSLIDLTESNSGGSNTIVNWYKTNNPYEFLSATSRINSGELITNYQTANKCLYIASCPSGNTHNGMKEYFSEIGNYFGNIQRYELEDEYMSVSKFYVDTFNLNEWHIYGSSRLGVYNANLNLVNVYFHADTSNHDFTNVNVQNTYVASPNYNLFSLERGAKRYELSNWLGNVNVVLTDKRVPVCNADTVTYFTADVVSANDYSPFGAPLAGRTWYSDTISQYRFGFNGKEDDNEVKGNGNSQDFGARIYDNRLGRWLSCDPLANKYPNVSPFVYSLNTPIGAYDPDGKRVYFVAGAGNDQIGWHYTARWGAVFTAKGIEGFKAINASHGGTGDMIFTGLNRSSGWELNYKLNPSMPGGIQPILTRVQDKQIEVAVNQILDDLSKNPLKDGEQLNLAGYSYGSVLQAHVALRLADKGMKVDNLILVGSPISKNSDLYKELISNKNIGQVIRHDITKDKLSNPSGYGDLAGGLLQNSEDKGPHFDLARPGKEANFKIRSLAEALKTLKVK